MPRMLDPDDPVSHPQEGAFTDVTFDAGRQCHGVPQNTTGNPSVAI